MFVLTFGTVLFAPIWFIVLLGATVLYARRGTARPLKQDPPDLRTHVIFAGNDPAFFDLEAEERGEPAIGLPLFGIICDALRSRGAQVEPGDMYSSTIYFQTLCGIEQVDDFNLNFGAYGNAWVCFVDPFRKGTSDTQLRGICAVLDDALKSIPGLSEHHWHRRENFIAGNENDWTPSPFEGSR